MLCRENDGSANGNEAGEGLELQEVVERHYRPLRNFAISLVRCPARADDLTQETILIFVRRGSQIRQRERVRQWLFTTLHREFLREVRRVGRILPLDDEALHPVASGGVEDFACCEPGQVRRALVQLPHRWQQILELRYFRSCTYQQIAEELGVPIGTVMSRLSRAHKALRGVFEARLGNG